jgi:hypothetical protein
VPAVGSKHRCNAVKIPSAGDSMINLKRRRNIKRVKIVVYWNKDVLTVPGWQAKRFHSVYKQTLSVTYWDCLLTVEDNVRVDGVDAFRKIFRQYN